MNILVVEDDPVFAQLLIMQLEDMNYTPILAADLQSARAQIESNPPDLVLLDQQLPDGYGMDLIPWIQNCSSPPPIIMLTGVSNNDLVVQAIQAGAYDFIRKPLDELVLSTTIKNALRHHRLSQQIRSCNPPLNQGHIIGHSPAITELLKTIGSVAQTQASILITGESGTGKEMVARTLHQYSGLNGPFIAINCAALVDNLLESELFGHEKGSFTGAMQRKLGKFELADQGTLFLDELGEMSLTMQAKLLRVLQDGSFERVGGQKTLYSRARIIAATHQDLPQMIKQGQFREDLYYRLNVVNIHIPPLRERMEDLPLLVDHLLDKINQRLHTQIQGISRSAWQLLNAYHWPGNIRELENRLTRAAALCRHAVIEAEDLAIAHHKPDHSHHVDEPPSLAEVEKEHILRVLDYTQWHKGKACQILGISRPALDRRLKRYGLNDS